MRTFILRAARLAPLVAAIAASSGDQAVRACGPFFPRAVFRYAAHPEFPLEAYAAGRLGIVSPTWARSQLVVAYRYLSGSPLDPGEQAGAVELWNLRFGGDWSAREPDPVDTWLNARRRIPGVSPIQWIRTFRYEPKWYASWLNCGADAFRTAASTLADRSATHAGQPEMIRDWTIAQDAVFSNCSEDSSLSSPRVLMPAPVPPGAPDWLKADREYQVAAARFYGTDYSGAANAFRAIAADSASPWRKLAPYLVERALVRSATVAGSSDGFERAEAGLKRILDDPLQSSMHALARGLLNYVRGWKDPAGQAAELASRLRGTLTQDELKSSLKDYTLLLDRVLDRRAGTSTKYAQPGAGEPGAPRDDLTDWILTFQDASTQATRQAVGRWRNTQALPWLLIALSKAAPTDDDSPALIEAGLQVGKQSPGFETSIYHVLRLRLARGEADRVRAELDRLLPEARKAWSRSGLNALLEMRLSVARSLEEALLFGVRHPAGLTEDVDARELVSSSESASDAPSAPSGDARAAFDRDFGRLVNGLLPARLAAEAARSRALPARLRRDVALAAWFRAALLGEPAIASSLSASLAAEYPALKPLVDAYAAAGDEEARRFAAVFAALRFPGIRPDVTVNLGRRTPIDRIDNYKDNWWCAREATAQAFPFPPPSFVSDADRRRAQAEWARLGKLPTAPNYLSEVAVDWARRHPADPRSPEALHLAVRATRFGCADKSTTGFSRQAFALLHKNYPASDWAKKTPYYY